IESANARAVRQLGITHFELSEMGQAFDYLRKARELEPNDLEVRTKLGTIFLLARHAKPAQDEAAFVLEREPSNFDALLLAAAAAAAPIASRPRLKMADFHISQQNAGEARRLLTEITAKAPDYLPAWRRLAEIAFNEGKHEEGQKLLEVVFKKSASDVEGRLLSGRMHLAARETT